MIDNSVVILSISQRKDINICIREVGEQQVRPRFIASAVQQRNRSLRDTETKQLFVNPLQIMNPSKVWQAVASGILTRLFILWLLTQIMQDRNRHREERSAMKRGPEENCDDFSSEGNFEVKSIQLC